MGETQSEPLGDWVACGVFRLCGPDLLRRMRDRARLTQAELAAAVNATQPTVAQYESGKRSPNPEMAGKLMSALIAFGGVREELPDRMRDRVIQMVAPNPYAPGLVEWRRRDEKKERKR